MNLQNRAFVTNIGLAPLPDRVTASRLDYEQDGVPTTIEIAPDDLVLVTFGSQATDLAVGSMTDPVLPMRKGRSWEIWKRLAKERTLFGRPEIFFGEDRVADSHWLTFTVTTSDTAFLDEMFVLTGSETGRGGLVSLVDSSWLLSLSIFHQPEIIAQPEGSHLWWGYGLFPEREGDFIFDRECDQRIGRAGLPARGCDRPRQSGGGLCWSIAVCRCGNRVRF